MAITSVGYTNKWKENGYAIDYTEWAFMAEDICLVDRCTIVSSTEGSYQCYNKNEPCRTTCRGVTYDSSLIMYTGLEELWVSTKTTKLVVLYSMNLAMMTFGQDSKTEVTATGSSDVINFTIEQFIKAPTSYIHFAHDLLITVPQIIAKTIEMDLAPTIITEVASIETLYIPHDCYLTAKHLYVDTIDFEDTCEIWISPIHAFIQTSTIAPATKQKIKLVLEGCTTDSLVDELIFIEKDFKKELFEGEVAYDCADHLITTIGSREYYERQCARYGISDYCYLINENMKLSSSYDYSKSTAPSCPCKSTDEIGCSYIIGTSKVVGDFEVFNLIIDVDTEIEASVFNITYDFQVNHNATLKASGEINTLFIAEKADLEIQGSMSINMVNGYGTLSQERGMITVGSLYGVGLDVKNFAIQNDFFPSRIDFNEINEIVLGQNSISLFNGTIFQWYQDQVSIPITSYSTKLLSLNDAVFVDFPENTCHELISIEVNMDNYFYVYHLGAPKRVNKTSPVFEYELTCGSKVVILCNEPEQLYECEERICHYDRRDYAVSSGSGYSQVGCPCGFNEVEMKYSDNGCIIVANGTKTLGDIYGTFTNIIMDDDVQVSFKIQTKISSFIPPPHMTIVGGGEVNITIAESVNYAYSIKSVYNVIQFLEVYSG